MSTTTEQDLDRLTTWQQFAVILPPLHIVVLANTLIGSPTPDRASDYNIVSIVSAAALGIIMAGAILQSPILFGVLYAIATPFASALVRRKVIIK